MKEDCIFIDSSGWCVLCFHSPDELKEMCPICKDYKPKEKSEQ